MAILVGSSSSPIFGSREYACDNCGAPAWLSPSGQQLKAAGNQVACMACWRRSGEPAHVTAETLRDVAKFLLSRQRN